MRTLLTEAEAAEHIGKEERELRLARMQINVNFDAPRWLKVSGRVMYDLVDLNDWLDRYKPTKNELNPANPYQRLEHEKRLQKEKEAAQMAGIEVKPTIDFGQES